MESLRSQQQEKEYQELIGNTYQQEASITPGMAVKELREQLSTIVNVALSVGSVAFAVWYWSGTSTHWALPVRTLLALFSAILVLVAETVVYLGYKNKIEEAATVEKAIKEVKTVVSTASSMKPTNTSVPLTSVTEAKTKIKKASAGLHKRKTKPR